MLPDLDVLLTPVCRSAHRSPWSHSIGAAALLTSAWSVAYLFVLPETDFVSAEITFAIASAVVVFLSVLAHAAEDALTHHGCLLLFPVSRRRFSGPFAYDDIVVNATLSAAAIIWASLFIVSAT